MDILTLSIIGVFVGFLSGFFGTGGGVIVVPVMLFLGYDMQKAVGISIMQMMFTSLFGSFINYKKKMFEIKDGLYVGIGGVVGASLSGYILSTVPPIYLKLFLCFSLLIAIIRLFFVNINKASKENNNQIILIMLGAIVGAFGTSIGLGGALFLTPILVGFLGFDIKKSVSMGLFFVTFSSISGFISMSLQNLVDYNTGFILGVSGLIGVYFGTNLAIKIDKKVQKYLLLTLYIIMLGIVAKKMITG